MEEQKDFSVESSREHILILAWDRIPMRFYIPVLPVL